VGFCYDCSKRVRALTEKEETVDSQSPLGEALGGQKGECTCLNALLGGEKGGGKQTTLSAPWASQTGTCGEKFRRSGGREHLVLLPRVPGGKKGRERLVGFCSERGGGGEAGESRFDGNVLRRGRVYFPLYLTI